jgi:lipopolysaccharide biosynthesis protein
MADAGLLDQLLTNIAPSPDYEPDDLGVKISLDPAVRLIAFYLPQFHAIPENDRWWGKGFSEWTNVTKAVPRFKGHYQPRLPTHLGFYDVTHPDTLVQQAALAKRYGIGGFCFHHYWFGGKRLLQAPIELLMSRPEIDLPFCVNWANENWTRRWDGRDQEVLIAQKHSPEDDIAFAVSLEPLFRDVRYIRVDGRPLLMVYRPGLLPDAAATVKRWRAHFTRAGFGDPYIVMAQAFNEGDPDKYGMDALVGFPPFWAGYDCPRIQDSLEKFDPNFKGDVVDYETMADATIAGYGGAEKLFPGVCPGWDNQARRPGAGSCFQGSSPEKYGRWLAAACQFAMQAEEPSERLVFINAWNEWAEGAYLEPDRHYGYAYLAETARVLNSAQRGLVIRTNVAEGKFTPKIRHRKQAMNEPIQAKARAKIRRAMRRGANMVADIAEGLAQNLRGK